VSDKEYERYDLSPADSDAGFFQSQDKDQVATKQS
jgi:hypothetical protein